MTVWHVMGDPGILWFPLVRGSFWADSTTWVKRFRNASWSNNGAVAGPAAVSAARGLDDGLSFENMRDARSIRGCLGSLVLSNMKLDLYESMASSTVIFSLPRRTAKILGYFHQRRK